MKKLLLLLLLFATASLAFGQNYIMSNAPITDCSGTFYDPGGPSANYSNNQNFTATICSDGTNGTHVRLSFSGADLATGDLLCFYDGTTTAAPLLSCSDDYSPGQPFVVQATAANPSGCITVSFISNGSGVASGWAASISCVPSCQQVLADLVSTNPAAVPADTGWIDICPGQRVFFNGQGVYPQNNFAYPQSDLTTTFEWNFGDGDISYGPNTSHRFDEPGGYYVQLVLIDVQGCHSTNLINQRVRVAPPPDFSLVTAPSAICAGDTLELSANVADSTGAETLVVMPNAGTFAAEGFRSDSLPLPDGTGIPYETTIYFTEFSPGQVLTNANDLLNVCVNMEHSWMRDIEISLTCPNGQSVILHDHPGNFGSQVFLGVPNDNDAFFPIPGEGFEYCWTNNAPNGTWIEYANSVLPPFGGTIPAGDYTPFDPFTDLIGCPLNGEWTITVTDLWPIDNGFIFSWGITFDPALYPDIETFQPQFVNWGWNSHPSIFYSNSDSIAASPQNAGTAGYLFSVTDAFGCTWNTTVTVPVLPPTHPNCHTCQEQYNELPDTFLCAGSSIMLDGAFNGQTPQEIRFEAFPDYPVGNGNHPHSNPYVSPIAVSSLGFNTLTSPTTQIASICIDIETDFDADLNIYLRSPDNKTLELSTGNGGAGDNYKITCFSPVASTPIVGQAAPFNGTYQPEGNWNNLNNAAINGDWKLLVSDGFGVNQLGRVKWWSISFNVPTNVTYTWTNSATLSCNNCPTPTALPLNSATYVMTAVDNFACIHRDTATVTVGSFYPAPGNLDAAIGAPGTLVWTWTAVPGASGYEVNVNGAGWQAANGTLSHTVSGLSAGDLVNIMVRAQGGNPNCPPSVAIGSETYFSCTLVATLSSQTPALCFGTATGSVVITTTGAAGAPVFIPDGNGPVQSSGTFQNFFTAGAHFVIVQDTSGCRDTVDFVITEPTQLSVDAVATDVLCFNDDNGSVTANTQGGTPMYTFAWQTCAGVSAGAGQTLNNLVAGCYRVTVTDANGCTATDSDVIDQPTAFVFSSTQDSVNCFGASDGGATLNVTGGTPGYTFKWDNGELTQTAVALNAGFHSVTVTDANGCKAVTLVQVLQPTQLTITSTTATDVACFGQNNGSATVTVTGGTTPYSYFWTGAQTNATANNLPAGPYSVTVSDFHNCTAVGSAVVGSPTQLVAQFSSVTNEQCGGACDGAASIQVSGGVMPYDYQWNNPNVPDGNPTATNLCPGNYVVTIMDDSGCTTTVTTDVQAAVPMIVNISVVQPLCANNANGTLTATISGGAMPYQTVWSTGSNMPVIPNYACGQSYTLTVTDAQGCTSTQTLPNAPCPGLLEITSIAPTPALCNGDANGQIAVTASGGTGTLNYLWNDPNQQFGPFAFNLTAGPYIVTVTDANGCSLTATATVDEPDPLTAVITPTNAKCFGESSGSALAVASGGTGPYNYNWNVPQTGPEIINLPAGVYSLTVTDANNCQFSGVTATVGQPSSAVQMSVSQTLIACYNIDQNTAQAAASGGNGAPFSYMWSNGQTTAAATGLNADLSYSVTASDAQGCSAVQSLELDELDSIAVNVAFTQPNCAGAADGQAAVNFIEGGIGGGIINNYLYTWNIPGATGVSFVDGLSAGTPYSVTASDAQGCTGTFAFSLTDPVPIVVVAAANNVTCAGFSDGTATVTSVQSNQDVTGYVWSNGETTKQITGLPAGTYTVTVTNANSCTGLASVVVEEPLPLNLDFEVDEIKCAGDSNATIQVNVAGGTPEYQLLWNTGDQQDELSGIGPGVYIITVTDANNCVLVDSMRVISPDPLNIGLETFDVDCFGETNGRIKITVIGGELPYRYSLDGGPFMGTSTFIQVPPGAHTVVVRDANGCTNSATDTIQQPLPVEVFIGIDTTILFGESLLLEAEVANAVGMPVFQWQSALADTLVCLDSLDCYSILVQPEYGNVYKLTVIDENNCRGYAQIQVQVEKPRGIFVPTGFTPNGDFNNDLLVVYGKTRTVRQITSFRVYDRWGELVWEDKNFPINDDNRGWDGNFRGEACQSGVYIWTAEVEYLDGYTETAKGHTTLIR
ncbi:MAG: proprotein convertase P-domain-containing protein [Saprospiraceae bacterium]|nr:proprotein convertase P-domain-containing protein [Saprospiraceae bacterium]